MRVDAERSPLWNPNSVICAGQALSRGHDDAEPDSAGSDPMCVAAGRLRLDGDAGYTWCPYLVGLAGRRERMVAWAVGPRCFVLGRFLRSTRGAQVDSPTMTVPVVVARLLEKPLAEANLELIDVVHTGASLRVLIDDAHGEALDLERVTKASKTVSLLLDDVDVVPGSYTLEVSSPGLDRPLRTPAHFARFVGREIVVRLKADAAEPRRFEARLESADAQQIVVRPLDDGVAADQTRTIDMADIDRARLVVRWETPARGRAEKTATRMET